ncbi:beta-lactamase-like protein [Schizophyllum amplum]|uniref:Beta-lactamase-like protein n=1 Tax=Schizophyllum amplum TaxID=97359 RepID=A0A550CYD8_9AGAR|nr:beta-lactamase-like protein [Auriculariopsis ampla]
MGHQDYPSLTLSSSHRQILGRQYLVTDPYTKDAVLIDTVLDYDPASGTLSTATADGILAFVRHHGFHVTKILETHAHADHLTASQYIKHHLPGDIPICIGERIAQVQKHFGPVYGLAPQNLSMSFDVFLKDDDVFMIGSLPVQVLHLPGHTPDHVGYLVGKSVFTGDSIFMPDLGSARADFPGGDARALYRSLQKLLSLPDDYEIFVGHDYPNGRDKNCATTVVEQREHNKHVKSGTTERDFVDFRTTRDKVLKAPRLIHPSLQVNVRAGRLPPPDPTTGLSYFRTPLYGALNI